MIAVRLLASNPRKKSKQMGILVISGYAPVSSAPIAEWDAYYNDVTSALAHAQQGDVILFGTDGNASIGRGLLEDSHDGPSAVVISHDSFVRCDSSVRRVCLVRTLSTVSGPDGPR